VTVAVTVTVIVTVAVTQGLQARRSTRAAHGSDLFIVDIDGYDRICKVEPFGRALKDLGSRRHDRRPAARPRRRPRAPLAL